MVALQGSPALTLLVVLPADRGCMVDPLFSPTAFKVPHVRLPLCRWLLADQGIQLLGAVDAVSWGLPAATGREA